MSRTAVIEAIRAFNRYYTNIIGVVDRHILDSPFSLTEVRVLLEIYHHDGCNPRKIREILQVNEGYLSRTIGKLAEQGLVDKRRSESDARMFALSLTDRGRRTFLSLNRKAGAAIDALIGSLTEQEVSELVGHMARIREILGKRDRYEHSA